MIAQMLRFPSLSSILSFLTSSEAWFSQEWRNLIKKRWSQDPGKSPSMEQVVNMLYSTDFSTFGDIIEEGDGCAE